MTRPILLLTRPRAQADRFAQQVTDALSDQITILFSPLLDIEQIAAPPDFSGFDGLVLTSENGAPCLPDRPQNPFLPVYCVGDRTAEAVKARGFAALSANGAADDLLELIALCEPNGRLLHLRGEHSRGDLVARLAARGITLEEAILYRQKALLLTEEAKAALSGPNPVIVPLFSPRTARVFSEQVSEWKSAHVVALSQAVADALTAQDPTKLLVTEAPTGSSMIKAISDLV